MARGCSGWRAAGRWAAAAVAIAVGLELVLILVGLPSYAALVDPASGYQPSARRTAEALRAEVARPGRGERVADTILWRYRPPGTELAPINSLGLRGPEPAPRRPGERRLAVLGGSSVFGWLVGSADTLPAAVGREMAGALPATPITVFNLGVEGYRFQQEVALLARVAGELDLDAAVFVTGGNDVLATVLEGGFKPLEPWHGGGADDLLVTRSRRPGRLGAVREALKRSRIVTLAQLAWLRFAARRGPRADPARLADELAAGFVATLAQLREVAADHDLAVVVVLQPLVEDRPSPSFAETVRRWRAVAAAPGLDAVAVRFRQAALAASSAAIPVVDGSSCAAALPGTVFQDWIHLSPAGNAACGGFVAHRVLEHVAPPA